MTTIANAPNGENSSPARTVKIPGSGSQYIQIANLLKNFVASPAQGQVLYYDGSNWVALSPGTSGQVLETRGAGANPVWADPPYPIQAAGDALNPADATTYYFGSFPAGAPTTTAGRRRLYFPRAGTIVRADIFMNFVAGTSELSTMSFRLNDTTDTTLSAAINLSSAPFALAVTGLSIAVAAGDYGEIKWVTPTWVTDPTSVNISVQLYVS